MLKGRLPDSFYNWISAVGALLTVISGSVIALLTAIDLFVEQTTIYLGILTYLVLPGFVVAGLVLIAAGVYIERRRLVTGTPSHFPRKFSIDFTLPAHRNAAVIGLVAGVILLVGTGLGTYKAYHVTESTAFCGQVCHSVMKPEATAHQSSPHARVACVQCHIGPGADWYVKSKMSGLYQVYSVIAKKYSRPIPTPVKNLRPARETCLQCHWPEKFFGSRQNVYPHYLSDEKNTPYPVTMLLHIGGGSAERGTPQGGIHWHMAVVNKVEYIAKDEGRQDIAWVRVTDREGKVTEYEKSDEPLTAEARAKAEVRIMDCIDCHNRPSHIYRSPQRAVNQSMALGQIPRTLPFIKREAVKALDADYADSQAADRAIEEKITTFYRENNPEIASGRSAEVAAAVAAVKKIYAQNIFPEMNVTWRKYPDDIGHWQFPGCFRCHGSTLTTKQGRTITSDCNTCHTILSQGTGSPMTVTAEGVPFKHPVDVGDMDTIRNCTMCHSGGAELY